MVAKTRLLVLIFSIGLLSANFRNIPDIVTKVGTCAGNWLKLETGTRAIGMGGAHVAAGNGVYAAPYNPLLLVLFKDQILFGQNLIMWQESRIMFLAMLLN